MKALCQTLWDRDEPDQAFAALGTAIDKLGTVEPASPGYVDLLLFRVELQTQFGRFDAAEADLTVARSVAPKAVWLRAAAKFARSKPDFAEALAYLRELADLEPLAVETHRQIVALLADVESRAVARDYLDRLVARFPDVYPLLKLRVEFLYQDPDDAAETATRQLIELCPDDAWASRQLALILADHKQHEAAFLAANWAAVSEPDHPSHYAVLAHLHRRAERTDEATAALRAGLEAYPDHELAVIELVELGRGLQEKLNALKFISDRLHASPHTGDGLLAYFDRSIRVFEEFGRAVDPEEHDKFEADLEQFLDERPDLWQTWSLVIQHLAMSQRTEEALTLAREATEQFPLVAKVWLDLAQVYRVLDRDDDRLEALRQALQVAPGWVPVARELAEALSEADRDEESVQVLDAAVARAPHDALAHWIYAERLWAVGQSRPALDRAKRAVRLDPGIDPRLDTAWTAVMVWTDRLDVPEEALELARELTTARPGDPRAWLRLARCLGDNRQSDEALAALAKAVTLDPRNVEAHDMRAERLAAMGRFDEALAAAKPRELVAELPLVLQGRAAWIEARRGNYAAAIPPMQALVAVDPDYIWGWQQLAEWYNDTNRPENYLEAASELARLRPDHPMSLTMRGEARLQTGDRDAGKHDLRDALRVHPGYSPAAVLLFDACLADGETREARTALAVLQEHLTGPEVLVKQLQFAARTDDADGAARAFAEICQTPGDGPPLFLQMAASEMQSSGWGETAAAVMRAAWETGDEFNPWAGIFWLDTPDAEAAELATRLNACDRVLVATPGFVPALDRRAELLAHDGRIEEALATCIPSADGPVPIALRGRVAWIEAHRGDRAKAIAIMKQVVAEEPDYGWGWRQLTQWYDAADRTRECLDAADHLVRLSPDDPVTRVIRGEARRVLGDQTGARDDFQRAFDQDPSFQAAGLQLIAAQLSTDDVSAAAETLEILRDNGNGPLVILRSIQVAARQGDLAAARSAFHDLTREIQATRGVLRDAIAALAAAGWEAEADEELTASGEDPAGTPAAAGLWVERAVAADQPWRAADRLNALTERNRDAGREAVLAYAWAMATTDRPDAAASTIQRSAELLRDDDDAWAKAGATLTEARNYALAAAWLSDWKDRAGQRPWMLRPLIDSLRALDRDAEAEVVARDAVERNADETPADFRAWLAVIAAVQGETAVAAEQLKAIDALGLADGTKLWLAFAEALVMVQQAGPAGKKLAFAEAKDHLRTAAAACAVKDVPPGAARWFKKVVDRLALDAASLPARAWSWWQKVNPWVKEQ